jgi:hypothetical protein
MPSCRFLHFTDTDDGQLMVFKPTVELTCNSPTRLRGILKRVKRVVKKQRLRSAIEAAEVRVEVPDVPHEYLRDVITDITKLIESIERLSLTPKEVEEALNITSRERIRWTKAGRLPRAEQRSFKKGQEIFYQCYSPAGVAHLAMRPEAISEWRRSDNCQGL